MIRPTTIVVGVDGSEASTSALRWSADLVGALGGEVVAVHALGLLSHFHQGPAAVDDGGAPTPRTVPESPRAQAEAQLHGWCAPLAEAGVEHRCVVVDGNPVIALLQAAVDARADLIVVGRRGSGGFPGLQLGSTSHELTAHARLPVVVVPGDADRQT